VRPPARILTGPEPASEEEHRGEDECRSFAVLAGWMSANSCPLYFDTEARPLRPRPSRIVEGTRVLGASVATRNATRGSCADQ